MLDKLIESDPALKELADKGDVEGLLKELATCPALSQELVSRKIVARYGEAMELVRVGKLPTWDEARAFMGGE